MIYKLWRISKRGSRSGIRILDDAKGWGDSIPNAARAIGFLLLNSVAPSPVFFVFFGIEMGERDSAEVNKLWRLPFRFWLAEKIWN